MRTKGEGEAATNVSVRLFTHGKVNSSTRSFLINEKAGRIRTEEAHRDRHQALESSPRR